MNYDTIMLFIYKLINNGIKIWVQNNKIQLFIPEGILFTNSQKSFIKHNKAKILYLLQNNQIYSSKYNLLILKDKLNKSVLSFAQERLWFIEKYEEGTNAYNIPMVFSISSNASIDILESSIKSIVARHEILRTLIKEDNRGNGYQLILDDKEFPLEIIKINIIDQLQLEEELEKSVNHIYDLGNEYPIRVCLYELISSNAKDTPKYYLSIVIHHIAFDGWSTDIFLKELQVYYSYYLKQSQGLVSKLNLPKLTIQYKDFALWQRNYLSGERLDKQLNYWKNKLSGYETLNLITDKPRASQIDYEGSNIYFELDKDTSRSLRELAKKLKVSLYSVLLSGYYLMLRSYSNQDDIVVGTPIANRQYDQIENLIGFFVNSLALRMQIDAKVSIKEFIKQVGDEIVQAQLHQDLPFEKLVEELNVIKDTSRHAIFQVMFAVQSFGNELYSQEDEQQETYLANILQTHTTGASLYNVAKFDISTFIDDSEVCLKGSFNYATSLYSEETINGFIKTYTEILKQLATLLNNSQKQAHSKIADLNYLDQQQYQQIINNWNDTDKTYPSDKTIQALFEEQAARTPNNIAIVYEETKLTYRQLNERANQLANYLRETYQISPDTLIALCLDRSEHMLIAILAVLKAGGAYVPIDSNYPDERISYILEDTNSKLVLTNEGHKQRLDSLAISIISQVTILAIDDQQLQTLLASYPTSNPATSTTSNNLAYVIYTSGTTGNPKGVMIEHRGIINLAIVQEKEFELPKEKNIKNCLWYANYVFDAHVWEAYTTILNGHTIYIIDNDIRQDIRQLSIYIQKNNIDIAAIPPTLLNNEYILKLNILVVGGDKANKEVLNYYQNSNVKVINSYGPSEVTVCASLNHYNNNGATNIGSAISNARCYVLDTNLTPLPIRAIGELYIGGVGLARGYLNRPELTAEKFIVNPFQSTEEKKLVKNTRLYKTGDLVRWLADGNLEYIGRNDFQVKIRGYRIELEEIESVLSSYKGITQSVVLAQEQQGLGESGSKYLAGYYVSEYKLDEEAILNYLQARLPEYMIPAVLMHLERLPLTINGKLDRKSLPDPEFTNIETYVAPRNELESQVCKIWAEVLGLPEEKVSIHDDFFRLGGNSILAIRLVSKLSKELNSAISIPAIFKHNTVKRLVQYIEHNNENSIVIDKASITKVEEQSLSFAQERLWFIEKYEEGTNAYNIPMVFSISSNASIDILESSIKSIVARHAILRTLIKEDNRGNGYQLILDDKEFPLEIIKINIIDQLQLEEELEKAVNHIYDLSNEYPIRVCLYELISSNAKDTPKYYLSIVIHHIAFDGWSTDIFLKELQAYYSYYLKQSQGLVSKLNLPKLTIQYKDFALWQRNYLSGERLDKQLNYWKNKLSGYETLNLITDKPRASQIDYEGSNIYFELDKDTSRSLRELAKKLKVSLYSVLLSGYYLMLRSYSNQDDIVVGTPIANRQYNQIENLIGFFVNSLALRIQIDAKISIKEFIKQVGDEVVQAQLHQDLPFEKLVEELNVLKDTSRHAIFQVMFAVQNFGSELYNQVGEQQETYLANILQTHTTGASLYNVAKFDISTVIDDSEVCLKGSFNYAISLYSEETINGFIKTYTEILKQLATLLNNSQRQAHSKIADLNYLDQQQYQQIINNWNDTDKTYPSDKTIQALFEEQVVRTPNNIAIVYEETKLTYRQLNKRGNQLGNYLRETYEIKPDTLIALCLDRSEHMLIAILGVLKAGGAYVPMDSSYPDERISYILEDTSSKLVLTNKEHKKRLDSLAISTTSQATILAIDDQQVQTLLASHLISNPTTFTTSNNLAYVIYTSGTTGNPKGVMIEHRGIINLAKIQEKEFELPKEKNIKNCLWYGNYVFDAHVWEIYTTILNGRAIYIIDNDIRQDIRLLSLYIQKNDIVIATIPPALLNSKNLLELKTLIVAGEKANKEVLNYYQNSNVKVINAYGPSEVTVCASLNHYNNNGATNIGSAISNVRCYVLDTNLTPLPIGAIGELYIGGAGLARGYLNRPDLTAEKFIVNPFQSIKEKKLAKNARLYKTGDLVRWLANGNLEYIGRNDFQVKIRGYRIELEEIESVLSSYEGITQSVVLAKEQQEAGELGSKYLAGYYVSESKLDEEAILNYLRARLPEYMIPALVHLERLPLTISGKLDRKSLPDPEFTNIETYVAPRNELESQVCKIWAEVLGLPEEKVSIHDDFFRLGGNSILAIRLVSKLSKELNNAISIPAIFKHNTVKRLVQYIEHNNENNIVIDKAAFTKVEEQSLSFAQERLWFIEKYEEGTNAYNIPMVFSISSNASIDILESSIKSIVARHEILRTLIKEDNRGNGYQLILDDKEFPLEIIKINIIDQLQLEEELEKAVNHIYDLSNEYPIRVCLYELISSNAKDTPKYYLSIVIHHIAFDGWSTDILLRELQAYYSYYLKQSQGLVSKLNLPKLTIQYKDFALWQRNYLSGERLDKQLNYWKNKLSGYETLNLITDKPRASQIDYEGSNIYFELDKDTSRSLRELAKKLKVSLYSVLLSGYYLMLRSYSNQDDIVVGTPIANRQYDQIENLIGFFVNSLALRMQIDAKVSIKEFIKQVGDEIVQAQLHQDLPFEKLVEELNVIKDTSRHAIFQVMFAVQSFGNELYSQEDEQQETYLANILQTHTTGASLYNVAKFDISTFIDDSEVCLKGSFNYATSLYSEETINGFIKTYTEILKQLVTLLNNSQKQAYSKIADLNYLDQQQYQQIINNWNDTDKTYPSDKTIQALFEEQVARTPNNIAIVYEETKLTYRQLNERANQLANYLRETYQISPDTLIALCLDRSEHMLIAILAVLKAGGAYVPIDSNYPDERISYILEDTNSHIVLTNEIYENRLKSLANKSDLTLQVVTIDNVLFEKQLSSQSMQNPRTETQSNNLAYVIYTSGTTGNHKGVMIEHKSVVNRIKWMNDKYPLNEIDKILQKTPYIFDVSVWELLWANWYGASVVFANPTGHKYPNYLIELMRQESITIAHFVPSMLSVFEDTLVNMEQLSVDTNLNKENKGVDYKKDNFVASLRYIFCSGEPIGINQVSQYHQLLANIKLHNLYGPTETTVDVLYYDCSDKDIKEVYIGKPIDNTTVYVLDTAFNPVPIGAIGELYVGGVGLARGYLNRPELTAEKFISNPFQTKEEKADKSYGTNGKNARVYKTGDLVRWLPDGNLEYIGRNDFQVKIRGYRIELGEIENALSQYLAVKQSVVVARDHIDSNASKYLVGYYVSESKLDEEGILNYLQARLPEYMIPAVLMHLESLPLTINGKLDRKSLPDPEFTNIETYVAPRNELESQVCRIWAEVLGLPEDKVSIHDDFFRLGGDSIISIQLVSRLRQRLGLNVTVKDIFGYKTIERLYDNVLSKGQGSTQGDLRSEQGILSGEVPLLPVQQWFFKHNFIIPNHWNQSFLLRTETLDINRLQLSITKLVQHHDSFRLRYRKATDLVQSYCQYYNNDAKVEELKILDINKLDVKKGSKEFEFKLQEILTSWQSNFDLEHGPTYSIGYIFGYEDGSSRIYFALHHLIVDAVSWRIIAEDLRNLYHAKDLGSKGGSYRQWVNAVREYATTHESEKTYWSNILSDYDSNNNHLNKLIASEDTYSYASLQLNKEQTGKLLQDSNRAYNTQVNDILLTALGYSLAEITDNKINYIVLEGHGREEIDSNIDITRTVGWFTTIYPIRLEISEELGNSLKTVKENLRQVPNKGIGYGTVIGYQSDLSRISFNYLGQFDKQGATTDKDLWNIISENSGISMHPANQDNNIVNINGLVVDGKLKFSIASKLGANITNKLADLFQQKLEDIISYTVKQTRSYLTVSDIDNVISQEYLDRLQEHREIEGVYLANSLQQGFIYHTLNQGDVDDAYRVQIIWQYNNQLALNKLKEAWGYAQARFSSLRLRLNWEEELIQVIDKEGNLDWRYIDLSEEQDFTIQEFTIKQIQEEDRLEVYDLQQGNLFRVYLIKQREDLYTCIFSNHHAILDGWSNSILLGYIHDTYLKLQDKEIILLEIEQSYQEAQKYIQKHQEDNKDYWNKYISQIEERSDFSGLLLSNNKQKQLRISEHKHITNPAEQVLTITGNLYDNLKKFSQEEGVTLNAILQYVWHKVLSIYGNSNQTVVGTTVSGRNLPIDDIESSVGLYINTLPLIVEHQNKTITSVIESIKAIQSDINEINSRSDISLVKLQKGGERLFDSLFVYENYPNPANEEQQSRIKIRFTGSVEKLDYPLAVIAYEVNNQLTFMIKYAGELFSNDSIEQLLLIAKSLLEQIVSNPYQEVQNLSYLDQKQYQQIINNWNDTDKTYPSDKTIQALFEEQAARTPNNIAIVYEETKLTYRQLNERANQLANYLRETYQISPDTLIALCLDRSEHMLIAILAVLKAGGAYVPMDSNYPDERISYILEDTNSKLVLTNEGHKQRLDSLAISTISQVTILAIDDQQLQTLLASYPTSNPATSTTSNNLAYVIYTSGTTGNPKGVIIEHKGVVSLVKNVDYVSINSSDSFIQFADITFDAATFEIWTSLLNGAKLFIPANKIDLLADINLLQKTLITNKISVLWLTRTLFDQLFLIDQSIFKNIKYLLVGGEALNPKLISKLINSHDAPQNIINGYGPTENTTFSCTLNISKNNITSVKTIPIGIAFTNRKAYVLDINLTPLPIGAIGELYIGGAGLARGYLNRPDLTAEKFIVNPFQSIKEKKLAKNARLYKTGDLVRWLANGNLEYIGRNDFQVKIRGYRIELEEIESVLSSYEGITQSVVLAKEQQEAGELGSKYLAGYYVSESKLDEEAILNYLRARLPEYMIPALVHLERLPLTISGKLDRKSLPDPEFTNIETYVASRNELESQVCKIWAEVLGLPEEKVSIHDDFFRLGGNSILAIRLVSKLSKELNNAISIPAIFKHNTVKRLVQYIEHNNENNIVIDKAAFTKVEEQSLSFAQERLWFIEKYEEGTNAYNIPMVFSISSNASIDILESSIKSIVARHEILRTLIKEDNRGNGYQLILDDKEFPLEIIKINIIDQLQLEEELEKSVNHIYDLGNEYPIRICLYELISSNAKDTPKYYLSIVIHHIAFDGWSTDIFLKELQAYYSYYLKQSQGLVSKLNLPKLTIQYKDFALWQRNYLSGERLDKQLNYWKNKLSGYETLNLITDKPRASQIDYEGSNIYFELDKDTSRSLRELAKKLKVSLYSVLLSGYYLMLRSYSNQDDIVVGTPIANRQYDQIENLIGFFVNSLALRMQIDAKVSIKEFIKQVGDEIVQAQLHQDLPFEKLVEELNVIKDTSRHAIFQVMFVVQSFGNELYSQEDEQQETYLANILQTHTTGTSLYNVAKFDISTFIDDSEVCLKGSFNYATSLYSEETINGFIKTYTEILKQLATLLNNSQRQAHSKIADLNYLDQQQYQQIINNWNDTDKTYPSDKTIQALFEEQVARTPNNIAIVYEETKLTYRQLNERANQLANYLRETYQISPDTLIALCLDRSEHMLIAILAVLKAGGAYVPIDSNYPDERISYILEDTNSKLVLTNEGHKQRLDSLAISTISQVTILAIDDQQLQTLLASYPTSNPATSTTSNNLAYVIYTSGTTGNPKGVIIEHKGVVSLVKNVDYVSINSSDSFIQFADITFDAATFEIWTSLLNGAKLFIPANKIDLLADINLLQKTLITNKISVLWLTRTLFDQLFLIDQSIFKNIKYLLVGGEALNPKLISKLINLHDAPQNIINGYGPTENTTFSCTLNISKNNITSVKTIPIGIAFTNRKAYVLDINLTPLPIGAIGELYIGGAGLARGYLNRPDLTAEKFIVNPFQSIKEKKLAKNARLYKTGDLVRWLANGNLEYIGRNDFQVKIRGYRIELEEIESVLSSYEGITQSVVLAKEQQEAGELGSKYLAGYYVSESKLDEEAILNYLRARLPEYMIPALVHLERLPLTINGKLDRKSLPDPEFTNIETYVAPRNELESQVCKIWAEVLGLPEEKVSIHDDFFRLGGNSILAIRLVSKLSKELNNAISIPAIFKHNTVKRLVQYIEHNNENNIVIDKAAFTKVEEQSLSFAQERLWFIEKYEEGTNAYNIPMVFSISSNASIDILESSIKSIVARHEILRTLIKEDNRGNGYQLILDDKEFPLEIIKINIIDQLQLEEELEKSVNHIYDLGNEYPIRICLYELISSNAKDTPKYYLSIVIHHIAFDGWSTDIFLKELQVYYSYYLKQSQGLVSKLNLPKLTIQYKDFALWQRNYLSGERLDKQLNYWKNKLSGYETLNLITDKPRASQIDYEGSNIYFELDKDTSRSLRELAKKLKVSLYSVLLSGYYLMLRSYSNQDDIVVGTPIANRQYNQIENLIGFFVNSLALRIQIDAKISIKEFIKQVGDEVVQAQLHQDLPFEKLVEELNVLKDTSRHAIFQVMFAVQNFGSELYNQVGEQQETYLANILQTHTIGASLYNVAKFDISTVIDDSEVCLKGSFNYATSLYSKETVNGFIKTYTEILKQLATLLNNSQRQEHTKIADLSYLDQEQYQQIIDIWNRTDREYQDTKTIHELFEEQAKKTPNNIAVIDIEKEYKYKQLLQESNLLSRYILHLNNINPIVQPYNKLIGILSEKSYNQVVSTLSIMASSHGYLPLNIDWPVERLEKVLAHGNVSILLISRVQYNKKEIREILSTKYQLLVIEDVLSKIKNNKKLELQLTNINLPIVMLEDIAYVIFTSGSTGEPKGVTITHRGVLNTIAAINSRFNISSKDKVLSLSELSFDLSVYDIFGILTVGGEIVLPKQEKTQDPNHWMELINKYQITIWNTVPQLASLLIDAVENSYLSIASLKLFLLSGDWIPISLPNRIKKHCNQSIIMSLGGATEGSIWSIWYEITEIKQEWHSIPYGTAMPNQKIYVLNYNYEHCPVGVIGEIHIGGIGVALNYWRDPEKTNASFIEHSKFGRLYKTGDLGKWHRNGYVEYIGRNDLQVKIRGYRIELEEIESVLSSYEGITQSVVLAKEQQEAGELGSKYLAGYYVSESKLNEEAILNYLRARLPEYMIPALVHLERLPLTINGKLDRKSLPDPEFTNIETYVAPRNELESQVCKIWTEVLGLPEEKVSIHDDFFRLGGNSILAIRLVSRLNNYYQSHLKISDIFIYKNIELLLPRIMQTKNSYQTIIKLNKTSDKPNIFMIHPGIGGCEVYISLANTLANNFSCYGIDHYNLYQKNKIDNLYKLAQYYLSYIDNVMLKTQQKTFHLLGWSLGGKISLEIASILEQRGMSNSRVYLLDTMLNDDYLLSLTTQMNIEKLKSEYENYMLSQGYDKVYIEKTVSNMEIEMKLGMQKISSTLIDTRILLFKAMLKDTRLQVDDVSENSKEYSLTLEYNNIDTIVEKKSNIKLIKINNAHHGNILNQKEFLAFEISKYNLVLGEWAAGL
ncbi:non-ribosomal peptide synthase/polyketide synthase [Candidatus Tisiphia endosymbiont of Temnostethus pusillus]|uniref:non-ribosomal peptide synthase/polyketide synthase n=1 Tax=Candidatus Tisiphia endosymbiont of Temnostethus pusillus TaxID=3139335 RepID=UPI0035C92A1D